MLHKTRLIVFCLTLCGAAACLTPVQAQAPELPAAPVADGAATAVDSPSSDVLPLTTSAAAVGADAGRTSAGLQSAQAATTGSVPANDSGALEWLRKIEKKHQTIQRIVAEFHQQKTSNLFLEKIDSDGVMYYAKPDGEKPDRMKIEYLPPNELHNWFIGDTIRIYNPEIKQGDIYDLGKQDPRQKKVNKMLLGFGTSVDDLLACFRIGGFETGNEREAGILFVPLPEFKEQLFRECRLWLNKDLLEPVRFVIQDEQDDQTRVEIKKISWNSEIPDQIFTPRVPRDVEWIKRD